MKLGDIYINKENKSIIQIDSFASPMGDFTKGHIIVFRQLEELAVCQVLMDMVHKKKLKKNMSC